MEFEVKDRVAIGDNKYILTTLEDGRVQLDPAPDTVEEEGTPINKELLQPIVDAVPVVFELTMDAETETPSFQNGQTAEQLVELLEKKRNVIVRVGNNSIYGILDFVGKMTTPITPPAYFFQSISGMSSITYTLTENGFSQGISTTIADYVMEEGSADGWTYRKWASGDAECWCNLEINTAISAAWADSGFYLSGIFPANRMNFPLAFTGVPVVNVSVDGTYSAIVLNGGITHTQTTLGNFNLVRPVAMTTPTDFVVSISVKGRWQ